VPVEEEEEEGGGGEEEEEDVFDSTFFRLDVHRLYISVNEVANR